MAERRRDSKNLVPVRVERRVLSSVILSCRSIIQMCLSTKKRSVLINFNGGREVLAFIDTFVSPEELSSRGIRRQFLTPADKHYTMEDKKYQFLALYSMVLADGEITWEELSTLYRIGKECYGLTDEKISITVREAGTSYVLPTTLDDKVRLLYHLSEIAWADGVIDVQEKTLLADFARKMGFEENNIDGIVDYMLSQVGGKVSLEEVISDIKG